MVVMAVMAKMDFSATEVVVEVCRRPSRLLT